MGMRSSTLLALGVVSTLLAPGSADASIDLSLSWNTPATVFSPDQEGYTHVRMKDGISIELEGAPDLPWIQKDVPLAPGEAVADWGWEPNSSRVAAEGVIPNPVVLDRPYEAGGPVHSAPDSRFYETNSPYPTEAVMFLGVRSRAGRQIASFLVSPYQWDPRTQELTVSDGGTLRVMTTGASLDRYLPAPERTIAPSVSAQQFGGEKISLSRIPNLGSTGNGSEIQSYSDGLRATAIPSLDGTPVEFLIITVDEFLDDVEPLLEWKRRSGHTAEARSISWIYDNYPQGVDNPERIRLFIRDAYLYWGTTDVLIAGDPDVVPIRYGHSYSWNFTEGGMDIATDYYYACLDGTWNANGNSLFGEAVRFTIDNDTGEVTGNRISDETDASPEVKVGRISARTEEDVANYLDRYMDYVVNPPQDEYLRRVLLMGEVIFPAEWSTGDCDVCDNGCTPCVTTDGAESCIELVDSLSVSTVGNFFEPVQLYERDYWWGEGSEYLSIESALESLNSGVNLIFHSGHGDRDRWSIGEDRVEAADLFGLTNGSGETKKWAGLVYAINCNSAAVEYDCNAEAFQFAEEGGGLIYIGSTNLDFPGTARTMQNRFFHRWPSDGFALPGDAFFQTNDETAATLDPAQETATRFLLYSLIFLGDPSMHVWTAIPQAGAVVTYPTDIVLGGGETEVSVELFGSGLADAQVTLYKADDAMATGMTDAQGNISLPFDPTNTGEFLVTVTHPSLSPYLGSGTVGGASGAFVSLDSYAVNDTEDVDAGIRGNGNGIIEIGETVALDLEFTNRGDATASDLEVELSTIDAGTIDVAVLESQAVIGTLAAGASSSTTKSFLISVTDGNGGSQAQVTLTLGLEWTHGAGSNSEEILPNAFRPDIRIYRSSARVTVGDDDDDPEPSEWWRFAIEFQNFGSGTSSGLIARLAPAEGNNISIDPSSVSIPDLEPFATVATDSIDVGFFIANQTSLVLQVEDPNTDPPTILLDQEFDLKRPQVPTGLDGRGLRSSVILGWKPTDDEDLWGYRLYGASAVEGPYEEVGIGFLPITSSVADTNYYQHEGLTSLTTYHYRVAALDTSGNESAMSDPLTVNTSPGFLDGWPERVDLTFGISPTVAQLNGGGAFEVLVGSDVVYAFGANGGDYHDGDNVSSTRGPLHKWEQGYDSRSKPAVIDLDGDGLAEVITTVVFPDNRPGQARDPHLLVLDYLGNTKFRKSLLTGAPVLSSPAVGNIDGDPEMEIVVLANRLLLAFNHDGTPVDGANTNGVLRDLGDDARFLYSSVGLVDVNGDGANEIAFTTAGGSTNAQLFIIDSSGVDVEGFPFKYAEHGGSSGDWSNSSPAVANLVTSDSGDELIVASKTDLWLIDPSAENPLVWRTGIGDYGSQITLNSSPALGDVNRDGLLEVVIGGASGRLYVLDAMTGTVLPAFDAGPGYLEVGTSSTRMGSPVLGDITGDGKPEIIIGDSKGFVHAYEHTGQPMPGFPYIMGGDVGAGIVLWDVDKDGAVNMVVKAGQLQTLVVLDFPDVAFDHSNPDLDAYPWTQFRHDEKNSGKMMTGVVPLLLGAPDLLSAGGLDVTVRWSGQPGFQLFQLYRKRASEEDFTLVGEWTPREISTEGDSDFQIVDAVPEGGAWVYRLVGLEEGEEGVSTEERQIFVSSAAASFQLYLPRPNPFAEVTTIQLDLPASGPARVLVLDPAGRVIRRLLDGEAEAGSHTMVWDGRDDAGRELGSGVYFVRAEAPGQSSSSQKLVHMK